MSFLTLAKQHIARVARPSCQEKVGGQEGHEVNEVSTAAPFSIAIPVDDWRWEVACWPWPRWLAWNRRVDALLAEGGGAGAYATQERAYRELADEGGPRKSCESDESIDVDNCYTS